MTAFFIGLTALRLLLTGIFVVGLYKIISLVHYKLNLKKQNAVSRGEIILRERLASGEIDEDKYRAMKAVLGM